MESRAVALDAERVTVFRRMNDGEIDPKLSLIYLSQHFESVPTEKVCHLHLEFGIVIFCSTCARESSVAEARCTFENVLYAFMRS